MKAEAAWRGAPENGSPGEPHAAAAKGGQAARSLQARTPRRPWDVARPARAAHPPCAHGGPCRAPSRPGPGTTSGRTCLVRTCPASSAARPRAPGAARGDGVRARGGREEEMSSAPRIPTSLLSSPRPGPSSARAGATGAAGRPGHRDTLIGPKLAVAAGSPKPQTPEPPALRMRLWPHQPSSQHLCLWQGCLESPQIQNEMGLASALASPK